MFKLVVIILCFATLLVSTGSALKKDEYEINIKHGSFAVHQRHGNADSARIEGTSRSVPLAPTIAPGSASKENVPAQRDEQFFGGASDPERGETGEGVSAGDAVGRNDLWEGEKISTTLAVPRPTVQSAAKVNPGEVAQNVLERKPIKSIDFNAVSPGLEEVPLQATVFQSSQGRGRSASYQSVEYYGSGKLNAQDFYNTPQLRERGPVLFATDPTTTTTAMPTTTQTMPTTTVKPPGKLYKAIPKSAVEENEEIYLLLKYEHPRKKSEGDGRDRQGVPVSTEAARVKVSQQTGSRMRGRVQNQGGQKDNFLQEGLRAGGSFTTVGYFVSDTDTTTPMTPESTSGENSQVGNTLPTEASGNILKNRGNKLRNSYGDYLSEDFKDFEDSIRPIEEDVDETPDDEEATEDGNDGEEGDSSPVDIDSNLDISEMARILAGRQGGLTISEFNRLFKDYLKKEITVDDLDEFAKLEKEVTEEPAKDTTEGKDPTKSFDIRAENGKKSLKETTGLAGPTPAQKQQLDQLKVLVNKGSLKLGRKEKLVKIGYGGSKSFQGVYKSQKFLEKVLSERNPSPSDGFWGGLEYRQPLPAREIGPMAYVDNPVFGFVPGGRSRVGTSVVANGQKEGPKPGNGAGLPGGQSYVKFQKIS